MDIQPPTSRDDSCGMEDSPEMPPSAAISTVTVPSISSLPSSSTPSAPQSSRPVVPSPSVSVLSRAKPPSCPRAAPAPTSASSAAEATCRAVAAASPGRSPPRPRLRLAAVETPWGEQPAPKASDSDPAEDSASLLREAHSPSGEMLASEGDCHHMSHLAAIVKTAACLRDMNSQVIVKIDDEQYPVETFLRTCTQQVNYQCEGLVNDSTSVTNIVNIETHEDEHEMTFKNDTSQWPFESIERTSDVIVKSDEDTIIGSPLSEVVIKVSESDNVVHDIASRNFQEYKSAFKPKIVRVDHTSKSLRNLPVQIEHQDKGDSWPTWPTAVVTIEIEGTDNEDI
ncbi:Protein of unknown function [Gryllus bimaculatus]|nr:Protein of unknown function [Gryllus bimaculatus]